MKIVINNAYGGFSMTREMCAAVGLEYPQWAYRVPIRTRADPKLVNVVEKMIAGGGTELAICVIPDEATDWIITDYDGCETLYYALNGRIMECVNIIS